MLNGSIEKEGVHHLKRSHGTINFRTFLTLEVVPYALFKEFQGN